MSTTDSRNAIKRIRDYMRRHGMTRTALARAAGLPHTTLLGMMEPGWNPRLKTIRALEAVITKTTRKRRKRHGSR